MTRTDCALLFVALVVAGIASPAVADESRRAVTRAHFERGERLYAVAKFQEALDEFTAAYEVEPLPEFLFNLGQCNRRLGRYEEALFFFRGYLQRVAAPPDRAEVDGLVREMEERLNAPPPPSPSVTSAPALVPAAPSTSSSSAVAHRWWLWTALGGVALAGATAVVWAATRPSLPAGTLGTIDGR